MTTAAKPLTMTEEKWEDVCDDRCAQKLKREVEEQMRSNAAMREALENIADDGWGHSRGELYGGDARSMQRIARLSLGSK